jgi:hypothetical protein
MDVITDLTCKDGTAHHVVDGGKRLIIARSQVRAHRADDTRRRPAAIDPQLGDLLGRPILATGVREEHPLDHGGGSAVWLRHHPARSQALLLRVVSEPCQRTAAVGRITET